MHAKILIVQVCKFLNDGDGMYRLHDPSRFLSKIPAVVVVDCHFAHRLLPRLLRLADVLVMQFIHNWDWFPMMDLRRADGHATVYEVNDNFYDVQPWNPAASGWRDQSLRAECEKYVAAADALQTSSDFLANLFKPIARKTAVFANQLPQISPLEAPAARPLTIGWGGSVGHLADWYAIAPILQKWLNDRPDVHLAVMTNDFARSFIDLPEDRYHFTPPSSLADYLKFLKSLDIGIAPLLPTGFNRGRSDVKFLEYAAAGIPGIYANLDPYQKSVIPGQNGFLYSTDQELGQHLDALESDPDLRARIRSEAYSYVSRERMLEGHVTDRLNFYRSLLPKDAPGVEIPADILAAAQINGQYIQLHPSAPERIFLASQAAAPSEKNLQDLTRVTTEFPDYQMAQTLHGRLLNDAKKYTQALVPLQRARALDPSSAFVLCEMARAQTSLKEYARARQSYEAALRLNANFYTGWINFLWFLKFVQAPDISTWAARAREQFPNDFALALLAISAYPPVERIPMLADLLNRPSAIPDADATAHLEPLAESFSDIIRTIGAKPELIPILKRACELFPHSARLADFHGRALYLHGRFEESVQEQRRALQIRRAAYAYTIEYPKDDGSHFTWQIAEIIARHDAPATDDAGNGEH
jgi:tetratricopeptide (TPR) repeat protein